MATPKRVRKARKRLSRNENEYLIDNAEMLYDSQYGIDRRDSGTGGGKQTGKHNADNRGDDI